MAGAVLLLLGGTAFLTLYLPAMQSARQGNLVQLDGRNLRLSARPDPAFSHGIDLTLTIDPPLESAAAVDIVPTMPTMGNMRVAVQSIRSVGPGTYLAVADLPMGGLWQVRVTLRCPGHDPAVARFRLNA